MPAIFEIREWTERKDLSCAVYHHKTLYLFGIIPLIHYRLEK